MKRKVISTLLASAMAVSAIAIPSIAAAQSSQELMQQIQALQAQLKAIQEQVNKQAQATQQATQSAQKANTTATAAAATATTAAATATDAKASVSTIFEKIDIPKQANSYKPGTVNMYTGESNPNVAGNTNFMAREKDDSLSFVMPKGGGITLYGNLDVSVDDVSNGLSGAPNAGNGGPYGKTGYLPAISTNNTYIGLRGYQPVSDWHDTQFLWQLQTNLAVSAVSGTAESNSAQSNAVTGGMTTGTTYIGLGSKDWGAVKIGKTTTPYANSTTIFNPFKGMLGSMNVVMGNTGGDNRVEFDTMMEHSLWYESPAWNNMSFAALFSPGQNRATDSSALPQGSSNCAGGNIPGSGGLTPANGTTVIGCNDGGFSNAFSTSLVYDDKKAWYAVAAYEVHQSVNRSSDIGVPLTTSGAIDTTSAAYALAQQDVATEAAAKVGLMYHFQSTGTRIGGIYENMTRNVPADLAYQNERQRSGTWVVLQQDLPGSNQINLGWAHAGSAQGDPGQHNAGAIPYFVNGNVGTPPNSANMYTIAGIHQVDRNLSFYANYALTVNNSAAHYDLGAGGHGVTTDCHDSGGSIPASGGESSSPNCWSGSKIQGISVGMRYRF